MGVIVTEGAADSGALYTADFAKNMGRPVFSVPGPITSRLSAATSGLLKKGAIPITSAEDVVKELGYGLVQSSSSRQRKISDVPDEQKILDLLESESLHFNELVRKLNKTSQETGSILTLMEIKGIITSSQDGIYRIL